MDEVLVRRIEEKRQSRDRVAAKLDSIQKQIATYNVAESKHRADLEDKDRVLGMLEELGKEFSALQERGEKIRPILQDMMKKHTEAGTAYKNDPAFIELFEENSRITTRLREIPQLANRVFFGKVKTIA